MYAILMEIEWQREEVLFLGTKKNDIYYTDVASVCFFL